MISNYKITEGYNLVSDVGFEKRIVKFKWNYSHKWVSPDIMMMWISILMPLWTFIMANLYWH